MSKTIYLVEQDFDNGTTMVASGNEVQGMIVDWTQENNTDLKYVLFYFDNVIEEAQALRDMPEAEGIRSNFTYVIVVAARIIMSHCVELLTADDKKKYDQLAKTGTYTQN